MIKGPKNKLLKMNESIDISVFCSQAQEQQNEAKTVIYRVESRDAFDNCIVDPSNKLVTMRCNTSQTDKFYLTVKVVSYSKAIDEEDKYKEYYFLSTSFVDQNPHVYDSSGLCDGFNVRFSVVVHSNEALLERPDDHLVNCQWVALFNYDEYELWRDVYFVFCFHF